jgi:hypothetical protein
MAPVFKAYRTLLRDVIPQVAPLQDTPREQLLDEHSGLGRWVLRVHQWVDGTVEIRCTRFVSSALSPSKSLPRSVAWAAN